MALSKDKHYWIQLRAVITSGQWDVKSPAKSPNGSFLSWTELLRKFNKHCKGFSDVAEVASQTQALSLSLSASTLRHEPELDCPFSSSEGPLDLGDDCILPEERFQEAEAGYSVLKDLPQSDSTNLALAYYAYSLSRPSECLAIIEEVKNLTDTHGRIPTLQSDTSTLNASAVNADHSSASSWTGSFVFTDIINYSADIKDGRAWALTETIRSICIQGMSHEKLFHSDFEGSFKIYATAFPLLATLESEIPRSVSTTGSHNLNFSSFVQYRELWRWVDRLLWRSIAIAARISSDDATLSSLFQQYQSCSAHWPSTFRPEHRSTVAVLHLRFLISRAQPVLSSSNSHLKPPSWLSAARSVIQEYRFVLSSSTRFPRAGEQNVKVEDFVDLCVTVWEASGAIGEHAGWVVDILWWAARLTFNSHRVFRHMTRLFYVSGDVELAKRTLKLYTQVVSKAWETANAESSPTQDGKSQHGIAKNYVDTDKDWVETLVQGSRMLCRLSCAKSGSVIGSTGNGMEEVKEAGRLLQEAKTRLDKTDNKLVASVDLADGIWNAVMAYKERDPHSRESRLFESLSLCKRAVETYPTASGYYHLALALSRPGLWRDINQAIENARSAVEGDPTDIRHWHLLGILLIATDDWKKARGVLDYGAAIGEDRSDGEDDGEEDHFYDINGSNGTVEGLPTTSRSPPFQLQYQPLLDRDCAHIPESSTLLQPLPDHPSSSKRDLFEQSLQLRMTQLALTEYVEGPEGAVEKWLDVFRWVAEQKDLAIEDRRSSADSTRTPTDSQSASNQTIPARMRQSVEVVSYVIEEESHDFSIIVTPTTPSTQTHFSSADRPPVDSGPKPSSRLRAESSAGKRVSKMLKSQVHRGQERISSISRIIGHKNSHGHLRRTSSAPDIHSLLGQHPYQASSIHSRKRFNVGEPRNDTPSPGLLPPPPPPPPPSLPPAQVPTKLDTRVARERRLLSDLWTMSAATFRRLGKIDQARGAIQEAEVRDESNPAVWVQLGLYYIALDDEPGALQALYKALFIAPEDISAIIHLCKIYLSQNKSTTGSGGGEFDPDRADLAAGMLSDLTNGDGWDVPEAWYFLAKAYKMQGRSEMERECLSTALRLSETTRVRQTVDAVGWCL